VAVNNISIAGMAPSPSASPSASSALGSTPATAADPYTLGATLEEMIATDA